jgi:hypothetical protein
MKSGVSGYDRANCGLAWMAFKKQKPAAKVEEPVRNGVEKILYFAATISADAIHSQYDIPALVNQAKIPDTVTVFNMGAWNDDPIVIEALKERIEAVL